MSEYAFATDTLGEYPQRGMSLRDYFAGQALAGLLAYTGSWPVGASERAYAHADAMLKERAKSV